MPRGSRETAAASATMLARARYLTVMSSYNNSDQLSLEEEKEELSHSLSLSLVLINGTPAGL